MPAFSMAGYAVKQTMYYSNHDDESLFTIIYGLRVGLRLRHQIYVNWVP